jgi:glycosyltransferase involved in cell wall biosynthesis
MKEPKISIITPSYNQSNFLEETILSVINQNYKNIEYIIIDGQSTDNSVKIIKKYEKHLTFWVSEKDDGQSDAIHKGFRKATGDILCWLNSDDFFVQGALNNVARHFEKNSKSDILIGDGMYANKKGEIIKYYRYITPRSLLSKNGVLAFCQQSMFFNKKYYFKSGEISKNLHYCMDSEFIYRSIEQECSFSVMHEPSGVFRWHDSMKSLNASSVKKKEMNNIAKKYHSKFPFMKITKFIYILIQIINFNYIISSIKLFKIKKIKK